MLCFVQELVVHFKQFKPCKNVEDPTLKYETLGVNHIGKDTYEMYGNIVSDRVLDGKLKVSEKMFSDYLPCDEIKYLNE